MSEGVGSLAARRGSGRLATAASRLSSAFAARASGGVWFAIVALLAFLVLWPIGWVAVTSLQDAAGDFTFRHYIRAATAPRFQAAAINSLILASSVGVLSVLISAPMAWAIARTDMPLRGLVRVLVFGSLVTPGFLTAMAWILLAGPNAGALNQFYRFMTGSEAGLFNIFSMEGMIFVTLLECYPFAFILISGALTLISPDMEDAANILGANTWQTMRKIVLPLALPAVLAGFILAFTEALVLFSAPAMIGIPAQTYVLTTQIWALFHYPPQIGVAAALALPLLVVTVILLGLQRRLIGRRSFVSVTGKAGAARLVQLGWAKWPMLGFCLAVVVASLGASYVMLFAYATTKVWGEPLGPSNFTLEHFEFVLFGLDSARRALANSFLLATLAATGAVLLGSLAAFAVERKVVRGGAAISTLAMAPMVIPGIVFAVGLFAGYTKQPFVLYGTIWILLLAYLTKFLPLAYMNAITAIKSVGTELEDAGRIFGASSLTTFRKITVPLVRHGLLAGWLLVFVYSVRELSSSILLFTNDTVVVAVAILDLYETGAWSALSALGCILLLVNLAVIAIGYAVAGRNIFGASRD